MILGRHTFGEHLENVTEKAKEVTGDFLDQIRVWSTRFDKVTNPNVDIKKIVPERYRNPCAWDINCGWCENWALTLKEKIQKGEVFWLDEIKVEKEKLPKPFVDSFSWIEEDGNLVGAPTHAVLFCDGRYYDSQHPEGVDDILKLDFVRFVSREDFLKRVSEAVTHESV